MKKIKIPKEQILWLPYRIERWQKKSKEKSLEIKNKSIMVYLLRITKPQKLTRREHINQEIGTSRYNLLTKVTKSTIEQIGENIAAIKAEAWYQSTELISKKLAQELELPGSDYSLYELIKELVMMIPKDYTPLPETVKLNKQKKKSTTSKKSDKNGMPEKIQKTPTITIKKKLKLPPKIIIVE